MEAATAQAMVMVDELIRCGVTDVVLAPGSRSAPLALELAAACERLDLRLHMRIDERVAGFVALGIGKATGVPAAVVTTSGTAVANLLPAVIEANLSSVPLVVLTADRPPALRGVGANQTIDQVNIFGGNVRDFVDMQVAAPVEGQVQYWRSVISRAVALSTDSMQPGPVHVNIPFTMPLVSERGEWIEDLAGRPDGRPWVADARLMAGMSTPLDELMSFLDEEAVVPARGIIVVGDHNDPEAIDLVDELSDATGWPIIAEPSANMGSAGLILSHGSLLVADQEFRETHAPDMVITVGTVGLSRAVLALISSAQFHVAVDPHSHFADPTRTADLVLSAVPLPPEECEVEPEWLEAWQRADVLAAAAVETVLPKDELTGMQVARIVTRMVPEAGTLFLGASSAVRHVASFALSSVSDAVIMGNRGASGIDGCLSTAYGIAIAAQAQGDGAVIALLGDQAFLYDSNALLVPPTEGAVKLIAVVLDNNGGGIFSTLEQGKPEYSKHFEQVFAVPLDVDPQAVASAMNVSAVTVSTEDELAEAVDSALSSTERSGVHVIVATLCTRQREADILRTVGEAVHEAATGG
ncbi:MAG: 2-succinyl-5-enolpyruvyl-6-hydroxy-3-cyclohexene-1-carboxylic-acid synthase [Candidatus Nanopelagicales bacterium]|nr:2-succinyl-5-enolpyruvyl-6-hydroxy-3-cyclohexene-1-carboxylic-acid synthase [Candidatus Nanopelagicales bacterium]